MSKKRNEKLSYPNRNRNQLFSSQEIHKCIMIKSQERNKDEKGRERRQKKGKVENSTTGK